jgi:hypothetical protein
MTDEDKQVVAIYMKWPYVKDDGICYYDWEGKRPRDLDLNDAGLCVKEMQKQGEWEHNFMDFVAGSQRWNYHQCIAWLYDADNFFTAMAAWLKEGKK